MNTIKTGKWTGKVSPQDISIDGFTFYPGQADKITALLGFAGSMSDLQVLPPEIGDPPFTIKFSETGRLTIENTKNSIEIGFEDVDNFIVFVRDLVNVSVDSHTLRPRPRGQASVDILSGEGDLI